jgi:WD40 repeat protein
MPQFVFENPASAGVARLVFNREKTIIAGARSNESVVLWDVETRKAIQTLDKHLGYVADVAFDGQGRVLATTGQHREGAPAELTIWGDWLGNPKRTDFRITPEPGGAKFVDQVCLALSPKATLMVTAGGDSRLRLWDLSGKIFDEQPIAEEWIWAVAFSPDGQWVVSGSSETIQLWRVKE